MEFKKVSMLYCWISSANASEQVAKTKINEVKTRIRYIVYFPYRVSDCAKRGSEIFPFGDPFQIVGLVTLVALSPRGDLPGGIRRRSCTECGFGDQVSGLALQH